jgi:hypothetical protein
MVASGDGLAALEMGVAGDKSGRVGIGLAEQGVLERGDGRMTQLLIEPARRPDARTLPGPDRLRGRCFDKSAAQRQRSPIDDVLDAGVVDEEPYMRELAHELGHGVAGQHPGRRSAAAAARGLRPADRPAPPLAAGGHRPAKATASA